MQASYDEKKRKKSHDAFSEFFSSRIAGRSRASDMKAAKLAAFRTATTQYYRTPTAEFQIAAT
jgi:hypothetical protein